MNQSPLRRVVAWVCAGALAVSACGGQKDRAPGASESAEAARGTSPPPSAAESTSASTASASPSTDKAVLSPEPKEAPQDLEAAADPGKNRQPVTGAVGGAPLAAMGQGRVGALGRDGSTRGYVGPSPARLAGPGAGPRPLGDVGVDGTGSEDYTRYEVNKLTLTSQDKLSTFAVDVDTASYSIVRRKIMERREVPAAAVRVEEFLNYFKYGYEGPGDDRPFAVHMEAAPSPYGNGRHLVRVAVQGKQVSKRERKAAHLVFLVDVSGSMGSPDKLPLAQRSLRILVDNLNEGDTVAMVTYAGATRVVLAPTRMDKKAEIYAAIDDLTSGGSTAMASGMELAYQLALKQVAPNAETRVIVLSDGDANVGNSTHEAILKTISGYVKEGVTLSTIGFGMGNYKDTMMEQLANKGNGNNYYIDSLSQAKRVFQQQLGGTLEVIAQDVKVQVEWNADAVKAYRLVGYENRDVADRDFRNDKVDAGEIGAGHAVTAVYEVELADGVATRAAAPSLGIVRIRAKKPRGQEASEWAYAFDGAMLRSSFAVASADFRWAVAVAGFAEILRQSPYADGWKIDTVLTIARGAQGQGNEERDEFIELVTRAKGVS
jgi:Ca-activated chloride channel family protein